MTLPYPLGDWKPFPADASTRLYFSGKWRDRSALLADFGEDLGSRERFLSTTEIFSRAGINVPGILEAPPGAGWIVQDYVPGKRLSQVRLTDDLVGRLLEMADRICKIVDMPEPDPPSLDPARLRFELSFFALHFIEGYLNAECGEWLRPALAELAQAAGSAPHRFCHRDFHSDNIIVDRDGELHIVDHQDALPGPSGYDAASLAVEAYRPADIDRCERVLMGWAGAHPEDAGHLHLVALQRVLKALGTFGYQVTRKKRVKYITAMRPSARYALHLLDRGPEGLGALRKCLNSVVGY